MKRSNWIFKSTLFCLLSMSSIASAADYLRIYVEPRDVGVFVELGEQQFTCSGLLSNGSWEDITNKVDWYVEEFPFAIQTISASGTVSVDKDSGLATIRESWGRVNVSACYPKGCFDRLIPGDSADHSHIRSLLLNGEE